jgi:hypothetical protein
MTVFLGPVLLGFKSEQVPKLPGPQNSMMCVEGHTLCEWLTTWLACLLSAVESKRYGDWLLLTS